MGLCHQPVRRNIETPDKSCYKEWIYNEYTKNQVAKIEGKVGKAS